MRMIDADEVRKKAVPHTRGDYGYSADIRKWAVLVGDIDDAPTIDAVPVVRCKECKRGQVDDPEYDPDLYHCELGCGWNKGYFFCAYGERKDGDTNV